MSIKKLILIVACLAISWPVLAWGKKGHSLVAEIALHFLTDPVKNKVQSYLNGMSFGEAANWMDSMRSNPEFDFMKPWHYLDFEKGQLYSRPPTDDNIVTRISLSYTDLKHYKLLCNQQVTSDLLYLFHLVGDVHQPLHTGYSEDKGGNMVMVDYLHLHTNLHKVWDEVIIDSTHITMQNCLQYFDGLQANDVADIKNIDFVAWFNQSRKLLNGIYDFPGFTLNEQYISRNKVIIEKQLLYAGLRLAALLDALFNTPVQSTLAPQPLANTITAEDAVKYLNKKVTVCTKVYAVKSLENVSFIDVGARFPNSPLTIVIFKKDRDNFKPSIENLYADRYICVEGKVVLYHDKPEIIVTNPGDITVR